MILTPRLPRGLNTGEDSVPKKQRPLQTRREFVRATTTIGAATMMGPAIQAAESKSGSRPVTVGSGSHTYEVQHDWGRLPSHLHWGDTHGVVFDASGLVYITHQSAATAPIDAIVVFDPQGNYVRSFGKEFHGGGHGLDIRKEGSEQFLYACDIKNRRVAKLSLRGEIVWTRDYPKQSGVYRTAAEYRPTNVAFAPDGGFYVGDGYGSHYIHQYDKDAQWVRTWGGLGSAPGKLHTPHGLCFDDRPGRTPALVVADRANSRLQYFTPDGQHLGFVSGLPHPCHFSIRGTDLLVPDLHSRVTILDGDNRVIVHLGDDPQWTARVLKEGLRGKPEQWQPGRFVHPHQARFDAEGNIFVVEWVPIGRVTKLRRLA
jgi:hypothetical protein